MLSLYYLYSLEIPFQATNLSSSRDNKAEALYSQIPRIESVASLLLKEYIQLCGTASGDEPGGRLITGAAGI